jgi:hypothetical protein
MTWRNKNKLIFNKIKLLLRLKYIRFHEYNNSGSEEFIERFEELSPYEQKIVLKKLREMVDDT